MYTIIEVRRRTGKDGAIMEEKTKIIYKRLKKDGLPLYNDYYYPIDRKDYERVMRVFEEYPEEYKLVACEYGFGFLYD